MPQIFYRNTKQGKKEQENYVLREGIAAINTRGLVLGLTVYCESQRTREWVRQIERERTLHNTVKSRQHNEGVGVNQRIESSG